VLTSSNAAGAPAAAGDSGPKVRTSSSSTGAPAAAGDFGSKVLTSSSSTGAPAAAGDFGAKVLTLSNSAGAPAATGDFGAKVLTSSNSAGAQAAAGDFGAKVLTSSNSAGAPAAAGDFGAKVLTSSNPAEKTKMLAAEIANGRLAMMAIISMLVQDGHTGSAWCGGALCTTSPLRVFEDELSVLEPAGFWDPASLTADGSVETVGAGCKVDDDELRWLDKHAPQLSADLRFFAARALGKGARLALQCARGVRRLKFRSELTRAALNGLVAGELSPGHLAAGLRERITHARALDSLLVENFGYLGGDGTSFIDLLSDQVSHDLRAWWGALHRRKVPCKAKETCTPSREETTPPADMLLRALRFFNSLTTNACLKELLAVRCVGSNGHAGAATPRHRDLFPLPPLPPDDLGGDALGPLAVDMANLAVAALNSLYGVSASTGRPTAAQRAVHTSLLHKASGLMRHMASGPCPFTPLACYEGLVAADSGFIGGGLRADAFDLLETAGGCDPLPCLNPEIASVLRDPFKLFPQVNYSLRRYPGVADQDATEYAFLVAKQTLSRKVELRSSVLGGGTVLARGKKDSDRLREIWHGARVSEAACTPPPPPHLLSPSSLLSLEASADCRLTLSKRDGRCLFDQLLAPPPIRAYLGRPPVRVQGLLDSGLMTLYDIRRSGPRLGHITPNAWVYPCSRVWPMGFSWSSYIAQSKMSALCATAGLTCDTQLCDDLKAPVSLTRWGLATDDVVLLSLEPNAVVAGKLARLDRAFVQHDILKHAGKDVNHSLNGTVVGVDLVDGLHLYGSQSKLATLLPALVWAIECDTMPPLHMQKLLGHIDWLDLLNRPLFSILDQSYSFARRLPERQHHDLPTAVRRELAVVVGLALEWSFALDTPWAPELVATDASQNFGFGVARRRCSRALARSIGRLSERRGDYVALLPDHAADIQHRTRIGNPHLLNLKQRAFTTILSSRSRFGGHATLLEAHGVRLAMEWLSRSPTKHNTRAVLLIDSKATLGAVCKGRSGARLLKRLVRRIGALSLAAGIRMHCVYIPSEHNPADPPSRGRPIL